MEDVLFSNKERCFGKNTRLWGKQHQITNFYGFGKFVAIRWWNAQNQNGKSNKYFK